jgi:septum formation protein
VRIGPESPIVLCSASPRRRELIASLEIPFVVVPIDVDETQREGEAPSVYLERIVTAKLTAALGARASRVSRTRRLGGVLVADTIVVAPDSTILGKPGNAADARGMIARLDGTTHEVRTRFALASGEPSAGATFAQTITTRVAFRPLTPSEIDGYVACGEGKDKAGAYAVQGRAAAFVEGIEGSYTNVVGLPLCEVVVAMRGLGWLA